MTKREQYKLDFTKVNIPGWGVRYTCVQSQHTNDSIYLSNLLDLVSNKSAEDLLEEVSNALTGGDYDEYFSFDAASMSDSVRILPPNAIINFNYTIPLVELKELLQEWVEFCNA